MYAHCMYTVGHPYAYLLCIYTWVTPRCPRTLGQCPPWPPNAQLPTRLNIHFNLLHLMLQARAHANSAKCSVSRLSPASQQHLLGLAGTGGSERCEAGEGSGPGQGAAQPQAEGR